MWKFFEKRPFFRADMAGLGKYSTGGYGRIGVYRVKDIGYVMSLIRILMALDLMLHVDFKK